MLFIEMYENIWKLDKNGLREFGFQKRKKIVRLEDHMNVIELVVFYQK